MKFVDMSAVSFLVTMAVRSIDAFVLSVPSAMETRNCRVEMRRTTRITSQSRETWREQGGRRRRLPDSRLSADDSPQPLGQNFPFPDKYLRDAKMVVETAEEEEARLAKEWADDGRKGRVLVRRKEVPSSDLCPASVCKIVFQALQSNDDPLLDYGAAVAVKFASSTSVLRDMTPKEYGTFLRENSAFTVLIDNSSCRPVAEARLSTDGSRALQTVEVVSMSDGTKEIANAVLTKEEDCWKIDAISIGPL